MNKFKALFFFSLISISNLTFGQALLPPACRTEKNDVKVLERSIKRSDSRIATLNKRIARDSKQADKWQAKIARQETFIVQINADIASKCSGGVDSSLCRRLNRNLNTARNKVKLYTEKKARYTDRINEVQRTLAELTTAKAATQLELDAANLALEKCLAGDNADGGGDETSGVNLSISFDNLLGQKYPIGQGFSTPISPSDNRVVEAEVEPFYYIDGTNSGDPHTAEVMNYIFSDEPSTSIGLWPGNVNVRFMLPQGMCASSIEFQFTDGGGQVNLATGVNSLRSVLDFSDLNGATLGAASITVVRENSNLQDKGIVKIEPLRGTCLRYLSLGGQELFVDNLEFKGLR